MTRTQANVLMLIAAVIWGTTFVAQQLGMKNIGPFAFTGIRFLMGALCIAPLAWREWIKLKARGDNITSEHWLSWLGVGGLLFSGAMLQQIAMLDTTVTNAAFLTGLYVPLVPILVWILYRKHPHPSLWGAAIGSFIGVFLLSNAQINNLTRGDYWIILSAVFWAGHVIFVGRVAAKINASILIAFTQFMVCGILASIVALCFETVTITGFRAALPAIVYSGVLSVGIGFTLQVVAQRYTKPTDSAVILSSETLFAAIAGALYLDERLTFIQLSGCALIFICLVAVQLFPNQKT